MRNLPSRARRLRARSFVRFAALVLLFAGAQAFPPGSLAQQGSSPFGLPMKAPAKPQPAPAPVARVIARIEGRDITQADFDRLAQPYFTQLKGELGAQFQGEVMRLAVFNVFDELVRRQVLAIESQREGIAVTPAEIDALLQNDPYFQTGGRFDPVKLSEFKSNPASNYVQVLPRLREAAAASKLDATIRKGFTPTAAQALADWSQRNEQVRFQMLPLLVRDMPLDPEATLEDCRRYHQGHPEEFTRRARVRLRYLRLPLPAAGDSTRAAAEALAWARAGSVADSLRRRTLPDSAAELVDTGVFDIPSSTIPGLGPESAFADSIGRSEGDSTLRVVGPARGRDAVLVGVLVQRQPKRLLPLQEALADVKRRADADKRRTAAEADRRAFWEAHRDRWKGTRAVLTRVMLEPASLAVPQPASEEVDRWYSQHGRSLFGAPDSSHSWMPPISDSLRLVARARIVGESRQRVAAEIMGRIVRALAAPAGLREAARLEGAPAETLSLSKFGPADTVFTRPFVDSLLASAAAGLGTPRGPRLFGTRLVAWRLDAADTAYVPPYDAVRILSDQAFMEDKRARDEAAGRMHFDQHRGDFLTPVKYAVDYVAVPIPLPDSVRVPEAAIRQKYDANPAAYRQEAQVKARHILFMTRGVPPEQQKLAKQRADSLLAAIRKDGGDFAELAKRFSQEPGAATGGGDLGWFGRGRMVREFETAAFALKPGEISPVVQTQFGFHIIKVEEVRPATVKPFSEVRAEIRAQLAQTRGDSTTRRLAESLRRRLALGGDTRSLTAAHGGVVSAAPLAAGEAIPVIGYAPALAPDLPGLKPGVWAKNVYRAGNQYLVCRLREVVPPRQAEFDEVKARAIEEMKNAKRREVLAEKVERLRSSLAAGASLDSVAGLYGGLKDSGLLTRGAGFVPVLGSEPRLLQRAFDLKPGERTDTLQVAQGVAWIRVEERRPGDPEAWKAAEPQFTAEWSRKKYQAWIEEKKKTMKIEILRPDLRAPRPAPPENMTTGG